ncbi:GNAT family N-acetyltransferase [Paractinoplanes atraurantiacus]|uniref:GNAT family N-acetyltransferase n=1 Tax=Paractinoplanes atraurantiacus TaxID=1036182 RepID=UPI0015CF3389|nr:GNAT family N-acetyltransferase [Actinoplanes atraurantiacus]
MSDVVSIRTASDEDVRKFVENRNERHYFLDHLGQDHGIILFAFRGEVLAGYIFVRLAPAEEPELRAGLPGVPLLQHLRVLEEHQRSGVARRLLSEAERQLTLRGYHRVALGVHPSNERAINLYKGLSFTAWREESLPTFHVEVLDDDSTERSDDVCLVFVKHLERLPWIGRP